MSIRQQAIETLQRHWGYDAFRPMQLEIVESVMEGHDTLGLLPTGGGKSITFQVPALMLRGLTLVITPLVSLMKDQVDNLRQRDIDARFLHAGMTAREQRLAIDHCRHGSTRLLYVSPEKLQGERFIAELTQLGVCLIVVDEAHCISQWGYDFRPAYLRIAKVREIFPDAPVLALTASATPEVAADIMRQLRFTTERVFARSFARDNLSYIVRHVENKEQKLIDMLRRTEGCTIVYVRSRRRCHDLARLIGEAGVSADYYHAGLSVEEKNQKQNRWKEDQCRVIVATNAFGMGIDKPDVRYVIHYDLPSSLEEYYQEAGRAGRDGQPAFAVVLAAQTDKALLTRRLTDAFPPKDYLRRVYELLGNFLGVAVEEGYNRMFEFNFTLFCDRFQLQQSTAHNALQLLTRAGYIEYVDELSMRSRVMIVANKEELYDLQLTELADRVLQIILRLYTGLFADYVVIDEGLIGRRLHVAASDVYDALLLLQREHVLHYIPHKRTPYVFYTTSRELPRYLQFPHAVYEAQRERMSRRIEAMKQFVYGESSMACRVSHLLRYFGEKGAQPCGKCDICREHKTSATTDVSEAEVGRRVMSVLQSDESRKWLVDELATCACVSRDMVVRTLRVYITDGRVVKTGDRFSL